MLKLLAFRTFEVRDFLVFIMPGAKNLALISTLCQIYALYNKCDILTFKRNHFTFFLEKKMWLMCVWHVATWAVLVIIWVPLAHIRTLPLLNLIFTKLIDNIIIYYIIMEAITSYITTCSYKKKKKPYITSVL